MSRCFGYPPPGYVLPENKRSLIDSIKLQKEKEKAKEERRKERKKEKKEKKRKIEVRSIEKHVNEESQKLEKQTSNLNGEYPKSQGDDITSDITNEQEQPVCVTKPSYSSEDSRINNKKRRRESAISTLQRTGSVLKIRFSSLSKMEDNAPNVARDQPSTSGRSNPIGQNDFQYGQRLVECQSRRTPTRAETCLPGISPLEKKPIILSTQKPKICLPGISSLEKHLSFLGTQKTKLCPPGIPLEKNPSFSGTQKTKICPPGISPLEKKQSFLGTQRPNKDHHVVVTKSSSSKTSKVELLYKSLLKSWVSTPLVGEQGCDEDGDWLIRKKYQKSERSEMISNATCGMDLSMWPRAQLLPSVNVYALPYTVPF